MGSTEVPRSCPRSAIPMTPFARLGKLRSRSFFWGSGGEADYFFTQILRCFVFFDVLGCLGVFWTSTDVVAPSNTKEKSKPKSTPVCTLISKKLQRKKKALVLCPIFPRQKHELFDVCFPCQVGILSEEDFVSAQATNAGSFCNL